jgi:hypothetical protein
VATYIDFSVATAYIPTVPLERSDDMPKEPAAAAEPTLKRHTVTNESVSFIRGLYGEYEDQLKRYVGQIALLFEIEARVVVIEKNLCVTRDHLKIAIRNTDERLPKEWCEKLRIARFVGVRLADACVSLLREKKKMTHDELVDALNHGMYRFRTAAPAREIHAALLRQTHNVRRTETGWEWIGAEAAQKTLPLRKVRTAAVRLNGKASLD